MKLCLGLLVVACVVIVGTYSQETEKERICEPGSMFMDDCNRCRCSLDGTEKSCTRIECIGDYDQEDGRRRRDTRDTCTPGSRFMIDCNECICPSSGRRSQAACTLMACP